MRKCWSPHNSMAPWLERSLVRLGSISSLWTDGSNVLRFKHWFRLRDENGSCIPDSPIQMPLTVPPWCKLTLNQTWTWQVSRANAEVHAHIHLQNYFCLFGPGGLGRTFKEEKSLLSDTVGRKRRRILRAFPTGALLIVINIITLSVLKVRNLKNFRSVSHLLWMYVLTLFCSYPALSPLPLSLSLSFSLCHLLRQEPSRVLAVICNSCLYDCGCFRTSPGCYETTDQWSLFCRWISFRTCAIILMGLI